MAPSRILVVDDEQGVRSSLSAVLGDEGFEVETAASGEECLGIVKERSFEAILLDIWLPGRDGLETLKSLRRMGVDASVVMISGHGTIETAVRATKLGAHDFVEKPLSLEKILLTLKNALRAKKLEEKNRLLREELRRDTELIGESPGARALRERIDQAAPTTAGVLIVGEPGTGKELVARVIHARGPRAEEAFVEVSCTALPQERAFSELFGRAGGPSESGGTKGRLELASEGTLYLHEVWALPLEAQQYLLRALESGRFLPQDGHTAVSSDARPIASTSRDLAVEVAEGRFREDLRSKIEVLPLVVPPLRKRPEDIPLLVEHFLDRYAREYGRPRKTIEPRAMDALSRYGWPGNVRELRNIVERLVILSPAESIALEDLPRATLERRGSDRAAGSPPTLREGRREFERRLILQRLEASGGIITKAAASLGIERSNLYRKMKAYGIRAEAGEGEAEGE